jgi:hypothetical protein
LVGHSGLIAQINRLLTTSNTLTCQHEGDG